MVPLPKLLSDLKSENNYFFKIMCYMHNVIRNTGQSLSKYYKPMSK